MCIRDRDSSTTLEVTRYLVEIDGVTVIDIDKYAGRYYVDCLLYTSRCV